MFEKVKRFLIEARSKITTYVALAIAGFSQLADHAQEIVDTYPSLSTYLPNSPALVKSLHWAISALGVLVIYTRVRRMLKGEK